MKTQQWQLRKVTEPRTLADVPSSREKPVLCWWNKRTILPCYVDSLGQVRGVTHDGDILWGSLPISHPLYAQPSRPKTLEDVPDRRVILSGVNHSVMMFRESNDWFAKFADRSDEWSRQSGPPKNWQLTDCVVELAEVEVGVIG